MLLCLALAGGCERKIAGGAADGQAIFSEACARCHGRAGVPTEADVVRLGVKDLSQPELQDRMSDADIYDRIRHGSENQRMPSFAGALTDEQIAAVIAHVRTLRQPPK